MSDPLLLAIVLGALIGAVLGLTGAGGGVLAIPALVVGLGLPLTEAVPVSLTAISLAAALGAAVGLRKGIVRYRAALLMAGLGIATAPAGIWLAHRLPQQWLTITFCVLMLLIAWRMWQSAMSSPHEEASTPKNCVIDPATGRFRWNSRCSATLALIGCSAGLFTGMLGVGGGFLIVPAFRQFTSLTMQAASATSLAVIALVSTTTVASAYLQGAEIGLTGVVFIAATISGLMMARIAAPHIPERWTQTSLSALIVGVALFWLARQLFQ